TVAETQLHLLNFEHKLAITRATHRMLQAVSDFELRLWKAQVGTALAYRQSLAEVATVAAKLPELEAAVRRTELALALLVGRSPQAMAQGVTRAKHVDVRIPDTPREIDPGLLLRRPDVAS